MSLEEASDKAVETEVAPPEGKAHAQSGSGPETKKIQDSISRTVGPRTGSIFKELIDISKINYLSCRTIDGTSASNIFKIPSTAIHESIEGFPGSLNAKDVLEERFPLNVTPLMNEENLWGCFYNFPEIYLDVYSPVIHIREVEDVPEIENGILTRDMIAACLSYLKRTPILGDYAFIKLDLSSKHLINIDVLKDYKYVVYLDLSSNLLEDLTVLSYLPYLQFLSVSFNSLNTILEYETPQWFLTEVYYKYNSVKRINDLSAFWSITILDLSHNNIKTISGLESLRYLRRLDLSFNHIQRLENLNHLRLLWLDVSYNNISSFEYGDQTGLWTLLHLEYLNLNENNLISMKMFANCSRLRELHARNNRLSVLLELAVYMRQMNRLDVLDLRANPICSTPGYKDVVINTFPMLLSLDAEELDPIEQRTLKMDMFPDVTVHASRRLLRLLYIEQLSRAILSPHVPPADTTDVPMVIVVGQEAVGKGRLVRRLASECSSNIILARQHTTAVYHYSDHFIEVTRHKFDELLLAGDFLTYSELNGESYGLSREEACVKDGKVRIVCMDLVGALMLKLRGYRPYLILATMRDTRELAKRQYSRKACREHYNQQRVSVEAPMEHSTLQVLLSGRIIITGILNEILLELPEEKEQSEFLMESECSLMMDSEARKAANDNIQVDKMALLASSNLSLDITNKRAPANPDEEPSLYSLFKESQAMDEYISFVTNGQSSTQSKRASIKASKLKQTTSISQRKSIDFSRYTSSTWKGLTAVPTDGSKSSKSVTFTSRDDSGIDPTGMLIEPPPAHKEVEEKYRSISVRAPWPTPGQHTHVDPHIYVDDSHLWLAFLREAGQKRTSDTAEPLNESRRFTKVDEEASLMDQIHHYTVPIIQETIENLETMQTLTKTHLREDYESIHHKNPGLFWDTVNMNNFDKAFKKLHGIIKDIVNSQKTLKPMFDIDFPNLDDYPSVQKRLAAIRKQIAPHQLFY